MKKTVFVFLIFLSSLTFGQNYFCFPDSNAIWREHTYGQLGQDHYQYGILGDTILQSLNYHKLYLEESCLSDTIININNAILIGAIREDSFKRVFFYNMGFMFGEMDSIYKIYDFSIKVGDTIRFNHNYSFSFPYLVLDSIDSVWTYNNYRKRYHLQNETWIENIDSLRNLLSGVMAYPTCFCINENVCFKHQDTTYYLNPPFLDCYDMTESVIENRKTKIDICVFPNPITSIGTIDLSSILDKQCTIEIYNNLGKKIRVYQVPESKKVIIDKKEYNSGLYIFRVTTNDNKIFNGKILID